MNYTSEKGKLIITEGDAFNRNTFRGESAIIYLLFHLNKKLDFICDKMKENNDNK